MKSSALIVLLLVFSVLVWGFAGWLYLTQRQIPAQEKQPLKTDFQSSASPSPSASSLIFTDPQTGVSFRHSSAAAVSKNENKLISPFPLPESANSTIAAMFNQVQRSLSLAPANPGWTLNYGEEAIRQDSSLKYSFINISLISKLDHDLHSQGVYSLKAKEKPLYFLLLPEEIKSLNIVPLLYAVPIQGETAVTVEGYLVAKSNRYFLITIQRSSMSEILKNDLISLINSLK